MAPDIPGLNQPIDFCPPSLFRTALDAMADGENGVATLGPTTLREFTMQSIMNIITDKLSWYTKVFDETIVKKWKEEFLNADDMDVSEAMMDYCIAELRHKTEIFKQMGVVVVFDGGVVKSDFAIPEELRQALKAAVKPLEDVPDKKKDWHPHSSEKVLDLVHPSLFPLVYGQTRILHDSVVTLDDCIQRCGEGTVAEAWDDEQVSEDVTVNHSLKFQWLPCDVDVSGDCVKIKSYINNLHPQQYKDIYPIIEQIIGYAIPLWNITLSHLSSIESLPLRIKYVEAEYDGDVDMIDDDDDNPGDIVVLQPEPGTFTAREDVLEMDLRKDFGSTLQVIVKLANIHLTPDKPEYEGGTWHVEGQSNEHICASAIYYYDSENITTSSIAFRQQSDAETINEVDYPQNRHEWLQEVFGCDPSGSTVQNVGSVDTVQGRLITFPNIYQHQVQPFKLHDPTKPGHRKILAFFLVDPHIKVISTANVPCQRADWWHEIVRLGAPRMRKLPIEVEDNIFQFVSGFPMSMDEAKELRLELMKERTASTGIVETAFHSLEFSLCEH